MIAILQDTKGFRTSINIPKFWEQVCLPIFKPLSAVTDFDDKKTMSEPACDKITFLFEKWIDDKEEVGLYKEQEHSCCNHYREQHCCKHL